MSILRRIKQSLQYRKKRLLSAGKSKLVLISRTLFKNRNGINLIGYFSSTSGVAEVGRFFARFLKQTPVPFLIYDIDAPSYKKLDSASLNIYLPYFSRKTRYHKNIFFINADQIPVVKREHPKLFLGRYNAAVFFWEFNDYFDFPEALASLHEVIAFTDFIATAVRKAAPAHIRVTKLPLPFTQNWTITRSPETVRNEMRIAHDEFVFLFNFDFNSVYQRKNPEAIIRAFEQAFAPHDAVRLVLKTIHGEAGNDHYIRFKSSVHRMQLKDKLIVINENLDRNDFMSIIHASDCYISLHRSEGLGLGMLEAMSMAKPVIGTNYGGNTDFMRPDNSMLVDYTLIPVEEGAGPYKAGWLWAEADTAQAAQYMKKLYLDRSYAAALGEKAKQSVTEQYGAEVFQKNLDQWMSRTMHV